MNSKDPSVALTYWFAISSAEIGREWQLLPAAALDATATPDGCWALIAAGTAPDTPPKRSTMRTATMAVTIGTRNGVPMRLCTSRILSLL